MNIKNIQSLSLLFIFLSGCATNTSVQRVIEYPDIPLQYSQIEPIPKVPNADKHGKVTVEQTVKSASDLRTYSCYLYSRYRELLRYSSFGKTVIDMPSDSQCRGFD